MSELFKWPEWMPPPLQDGFTIQPVDRRLHSETEVGSIIRKHFDTDECECQCSILLDQDEAAWFETFERNYLVQGTAWFQFPLWVGGELRLHNVRFKEHPKAGDVVAFHTTYTLNLQVSKRDLFLSNDDFDLLVYISTKELRYFEEKLNYIINVMMPEVTLLSFPLFPEINFSAECPLITTSEECVYE